MYWNAISIWQATLISPVFFPSFFFVVVIKVRLQSTQFRRNQTTWFTLCRATSHFFKVSWHMLNVPNLINFFDFDNFDNFLLDFWGLWVHDTTQNRFQIDLWQFKLVVCQKYHFNSSIIFQNSPFFLTLKNRVCCCCCCSVCSY